ncbi:hypothetical protein AB0F07_05645 [Streptomyces fructofermentans]|uniref:hypothetical protein n=1 Tax=Streptomyces fructofermentans TaxID=152141 RepID=UPI0033C64D26
MTSDEYVCPVCKQPVETVVHRHKTLGVFVPVWGRGPCVNTECGEYRGRAAEGVAAPGAEAGPALAVEPGPPDVAGPPSAPGAEPSP